MPGANRWRWTAFLLRERKARNHSLVPRRVSMSAATGVRSAVPGCRRRKFDMVMARSVRIGSAAVFRIWLASRPSSRPCGLSG